MAMPRYLVALGLLALAIVGMGNDQWELDLVGSDQGAPLCSGSPSPWLPRGGCIQPRTLDTPDHTATGSR